MSLTDIVATIKKPIRVYTKELELNEPFLNFAARFADRSGTTVLMSGGDLDCAEYHIMGTSPWFELISKNDVVTLSDGTQTTSIKAEPLAVIKKILAHCHLPDLTKSVPLASGLMGYFAYDLKDRLESLPRTSVDDLGLPDIYLNAPQIVVVHDRKQNQTTLHVTELPGVDQNDVIESFLAQCTSRVEETNISAPAGGKFHSNTTRAEYEHSVDRIIDYIAAGDVYQVNMSQRFETQFTGSPYKLFKSLYRQNPAPFFSYINANDHHIISTSPERFIKLDGRQVETRPIKGTRPRGKTPAQDEKNRRQLVTSPKDDAELSMIVDLLRNDLGKVCQKKSVEVSRHKKLEAYDNVFHMISIIEGTLEQNKDAADIIAATFPGGSITGCPKIRAMEIIDELEPVRRHIYTGAIGYLSFHDTMDLSVAIRTATICNDKLFYAAGGGIVYDSNPADEFAETLAKADTMLTSFTGDNLMKTCEQKYTWLNGKIIPADEAVIPADSPGFQYGAGLFETIRADQSGPRFLKQHIQRLTSSWADLFQTPAPDITWDEVIGQVVTANHLENDIAAIKIMAAHGSRTERPFGHTLVVTARPYIHRLEHLNKSGLDLVVYPTPRQVDTANHKTLNYFFYYRAGIWARQNSGDEAIIMNPDGTISETNTTNILLICGKKVVVPISQTVLNGIMQTEVQSLLKTWGYEVVQEKITLKTCLAADQILLTNSLMGAIQALTIDGQKTGSLSDLADRINQEVL